MKKDKSHIWYYVIGCLSILVSIANIVAACLNTHKAVIVTHGFCGGIWLTIAIFYFVNAHFQRKI